MTGGELAKLCATVQRNCDLADAVHAQDLSLCIYLLQMREFFRWERGLPLDAPPDRAEVGRWISTREARWQELAEESGAGYVPLPIAGGVDPFDEAAINAGLAASGLVYAAGLGRFGRAEFVLAARLETQHREGATVVVTGREFARGMNPPLAASRGDQVLVRRDLLRRWLGTRIELSRQRPAAEALGAAIDAWRADEPPQDTLERIADAETETLILHELGERRAGALLGAGWEDMLGSLTSRRTELVARAIRDLLADCLLTLPALIERDARASIHFWFANLEGMRGLLGAGLRVAYTRWRAARPGGADGAPELLAALREEAGVQLERARRLLAAWQAEGDRGADAVSDALADVARIGSPHG